MQVCNDSELFQPQHRKKAAQCCSLFCCRTRSAHQRQLVTCHPSAKIWIPVSLTQAHTEPMEGDQGPGQESLLPHQLQHLFKQTQLPEKIGNLSSFEKLPLSLPLNLHSPPSYGPPRNTIHRLSEST